MLLPENCIHHVLSSVALVIAMLHQIVADKFYVELESFAAFAWILKKLTIFEINSMSPCNLLKLKCWFQSAIQIYVIPGNN